MFNLMSFAITNQQFPSESIYPNLKIIVCFLPKHNYIYNINRFQSNKQSSERNGYWHSKFQSYNCFSQESHQPGNKRSRIIKSSS